MFPSVEIDKIDVLKQERVRGKKIDWDDRILNKKRMKKITDSNQVEFDLSNCNRVHRNDAEILLSVLPGINQMPRLADGLFSSSRRLNLN
mmetsp:Transcript_40318/g.94731  ORF Transcript_40318/g.94731 Transcript_40318/m.94731 type:complete len:90 (+) Transcript_40318:1177-1446(+)